MDGWIQYAKHSLRSIGLDRYRGLFAFRLGVGGRVQCSGVTLAHSHAVQRTDRRVCVLQSRPPPPRLRPVTVTASPTTELNLTNHQVNYVDI